LDSKNSLWYTVVQHNANVPQPAEGIGKYAFQIDKQKIGERGLESMPRKGELSKTARASLANREESNHMTSRICAKCGEAIMLKELQPVKVMGKGMVFYHKSHYNMQ
jgi:hypothetical protein